MVATAAIAAFHTAWSKGALAASIISGLAAVSAAFASFAINAKKSAEIQMHAMGASDIDGGTLFVAGEMGKTEMVYNGTNGKSNVANIQQIQQAMYNALVAYGRTEGNGGKPIVVYLDGEKVYENTTSHAKQRGNVWSHA